jgi:hypothetical protein
MFDRVVMLDEAVTCPAGHPLGELQTKSFSEPSMTTYLIEGSRVTRTAPRWHRDEEERSAWRIQGDEAVHETLYRLESVIPPAEVLVYSYCAHCEPVLVRTDRLTLSGDIVQEHRLFVEIELRFPEGVPMSVKRVSGDRQRLADKLRRAGLLVLEDYDPLAVAHREILRAKRESARRAPGGL